MCCGWQFLQFKGCADTMHMESWQRHMSEICIAEKKNQLERLGSETINSDFLRHCHVHKITGQNIHRPWSVLSDTDYYNMPFVVWARVRKYHPAPDGFAHSHPPQGALYQWQVQAWPWWWASAQGSGSGWNACDHQRQRHPVRLSESDESRQSNVQTRRHEKKRSNARSSRCPRPTPLPERCTARSSASIMG